MPASSSLARQPWEIQVIRRYRLWPGGIETDAARWRIAVFLPVNCLDGDTVDSKARERDDGAR